MVAFESKGTVNAVVECETFSVCRAACLYDVFSSQQILLPSVEGWRASVAPTIGTTPPITALADTNNVCRCAAKSTAISESR